MDQNMLMHYGILGMKWGVRRTEAQLARARGGKSKSSSEEASEDYKKAHSSKSVKTMSDAELRSRINRIQMEQQYAKLNPTAVDRGKSAANKIMKSATTVATVTTTALTIYNNLNKISDVSSAMNIKSKVAGVVAAAMINRAVRKSR